MKRLNKRASKGISPKSAAAGFAETQASFVSEQPATSKGIVMPDGSTFGREQLSSTLSSQSPSKPVRRRGRPTASQLWREYQEKRDEWSALDAAADKELERLYASCSPRPACIMGRNIDGTTFPMNLDELRHLSPFGTKEEKAAARRRVAAYRKWHSDRAAMVRADAAYQSAEAAARAVTRKYNAAEKRLTTAPIETIEDIAVRLRYIVSRQEDFEMGTEVATLCAAVEKLHAGQVLMSPERQQSGSDVVWAGSTEAPKKASDDTKSSTNRQSVMTGKMQIAIHGLSGILGALDAFVVDHAADELYERWYLDNQIACLITAGKQLAEEISEQF